MQNCYLLILDFNHSGDPEYDAFHIPFDGAEKIGSDIMGIRDIPLPERIFYTANFDLIPSCDYPLTDLNIPVMSDRMFELLNGISHLKCKTVPITMIDDSYLDHPFDEQGEFKPEVNYVEGYLTVKFTEFSSGFDFERSVYEPHMVFPDNVGIIEKLVLKEPPSGFPSIFRLKECRDKIFISQTAKELLEANNIKGCVFEQVTTTGAAESESIPTKIVVIDLDETNKTILALLSAHPNGLSYGYFDRLISEHIPTIQSSVPSLSSRISTMQAQGLIEETALKITKRGLLLL